MSSFPWDYLLKVFLISFLCGSVPFGYLIGRLNKVDLRKHGSGNIGATNVWRVLGKGWGSLAFVLDFAKGFFPVWLFAWGLIMSDFGDGVAKTETLAEIVLCTAALAAILGHNFTPWLGFKGGKGIATSAGVLAAMLPASLGVIFVVWAVFFGIWRIVSLASMAAAAALPIATWFFYPNHPIFLGFTIAAALLTIVRHQSNIGRLLRGEEKRIGAGSSSPKK